MIRNGLVPFQMPPRTLLGSFGPKLPCENLFDGYTMCRTHHFHHSLENVIFKNLKNHQFSLQNPSKWLFQSSKIKKSPPPFVWCNKNRFTRRTGTPFNSAGTHGPKHVSESKFWILTSFENFLRALQVKPSRSRNGNFWRFTSDFRQNLWKSSKNR